MKNPPFLVHLCGKNTLGRKRFADVCLSEYCNLLRSQPFQPTAPPNSVELSWLLHMAVLQFIVTITIISDCYS